LRSSRKSEASVPCGKLQRVEPSSVQLAEYNDWIIECRSDQHTSEFTSRYPTGVEAFVLTSRVNDNPTGIIMPDKNIPTLVLVGGFLGAGKTTLIASAAGLLQKRGTRTAVIMNDQNAGLVDSRFTAA